MMDLKDGNCFSFKKNILSYNKYIYRIVSYAWNNKDKYIFTTASDVKENSEILVTFDQEKGTYTLDKNGEQLRLVPKQ